MRVHIVYLDHRPALLQQKENQCPNKDVSERESVCLRGREREKEKYRCVCVIPSSNSCCFAWTQHMNLIWKDNGSALMCTTAATLSPSLQKFFGYLCSFLLAVFKFFFCRCRGFLQNHLVFQRLRRFLRNTFHLVFRPWQASHVGERSVITKSP